MINLLDPRLWLVVLIGMALSFGAGNFHGHRAEAAHAELVKTKADEKVAQAQTEATVTVTTGERAMAKRLDINEQNHQKEKDDAEITIANLRTDVRNGVVRLSIATRAARQNADTGNSTAAGDNQETRSELVPAAADALISIAADGDSGMRDLNTCIDDYNAARDEMKQTADVLAKQK